MIAMQLPPALPTPAINSVEGRRPSAMTSQGRSAKQWFPDARLAALAEAAAQGQVEEVERLLGEGVPVDGVGADKYTPLTFALTASILPSDGRNVRGVEALLKHGADPNHRIDAPRAWGGVPIILLVARWSTAPPLLEAMLRHGCDPNTRKPVDLKYAKKLSYQGDSLLSLSVRHLESIKLLVKYGADVNLRPHNESMSASLTAAEGAAVLGQFDTVEFLVTHGTKDLDAVADTLQSLRYPAKLHQRRLELLKLLKDRGAKIYSGYKPTKNPKIQFYPPNDTPQEWISTGYYEPQLSLEDKPVEIPEEWLKQDH